ncbi:transporter [Mesorhizobium sp. B2-3-3]|nr:transporter [Mesorhizobium sp. B2-3-3]
MEPIGTLPEAAIRIAVMVSPTIEGSGEFEQFLSVYYALQDAGAEAVIASASGGYSWPTTPKRAGEGDGNLEARFRGDRKARDDLANTLQFRQIFVEDFHGGLCIGDPGAIWRDADVDSAAALIARFLQVGRPVAVLRRALEIEPEGAAAGLLIIGDNGWSHAVQALMAAARKNTRTLS